jgi:hypothetical protein
MYKFLTISTLLLGLALAPVLGGSVGQERTPSVHPDSLHPDHFEQLDEQERHNVRDQSVQLVAAIASCEWRCEACEPDQGCSQTCTEVGNCGSTCDVVARCDVDYAWDEASCSCVN